MKTIQNTVLTVLVFVSAGLTAQADLYVESGQQFGPDSLIYDSRTGLTWLKLTFSEGLSYSQTSADFQPGAQFAGFRYATADEVLSLFNSAGFGQGTLTQTDPGYSAAGALMSLIGMTAGGETVGITGTLVNWGDTSLAELSYITFNPGTSVYYVVGTVGNTDYALNTSYSSVGNWLVAVPEPSICALIFAGGILVPGLRGRRVRVKN